MYYSEVRFKTKSQILTCSQVFNDYRSASKYISEFPDVISWSISPIKVLAPIAKKGQDFSVCINVIDLRHNVEVNNDVGIGGIQDFVDNLDLSNVSEIKIRLLRWI